MKNINKSLWIAIVSWSAWFGMFLSIIILNLVHAIITGFFIFGIWLINISVIILIAIRDYIRIFKKNNKKRAKK